MVRGPGDGWVVCDGGHRHWGLHGAAGVLLVRGGDAGPEVLLQHRAPWTHQGDTWGLPGGARRPRESAVGAALREAAEEVGLATDRVRVLAVSVADHGGWSYRTVVARTTGDGPVTDLRSAEARHETAALAWVSEPEVTGLPLHPGFAGAWPTVRRLLTGLDVVVDAANVVGATPDGWWRDRVGATERLLARLAALPDAGVPAGDAPVAAPPTLERWYPTVSVVVEGASRHVRAGPGAALDVVAAAPGQSGDDAVVALVERLAATPGRRVVVVTADRGLRRRCAVLGAALVGPRWLP